MQILVFKTNLSDSSHINAIESNLNVHPYIFKWNVDLQDRYNILRVGGIILQAKKWEQC